MLCSTSKGYVMLHIDFQNSYITCHTTCYIIHLTSYIPPSLYNSFFILI